MKKWYIFSAIFVLLMFAAMLAGCGTSGRTTNESGPQAGAFRVVVNWPESKANTKFIPDGSDVLAIIITGDGLDEPRSVEFTGLTGGSHAIVIEDLPVGKKEALIQAKQGEVLKTQRKVPFIIKNNDETDGGNVQLGIAITKDEEENFVFEPSSLSAVYNNVIPFQNWTDEEVTVTGFSQGITDPLTLPAVHEEGGLTVYPLQSRTIPPASVNLGLSGKQTRAKITVPAATSYQFMRKWTVNSNPQGVAVDADGYVYVANPSSHNVYKYDSSGVLQTGWGNAGAIGGLGTEDGKFNTAVAINVDIQGNLYVSDNLNHRIQKFNSSGVFQAKWGKVDGNGAPVSGSDNGEFNSPGHLTFNAEGNLYILDGGNSRIQKFSSPGVFETKWGGLAPSGVAVSPDGNVYISEYSNGRVLKYSSNGSPITPTLSVSYPAGLAFDSDGNIFVVQHKQPPQVFKFNSNNVQITVWGGSGSNNSQFIAPTNTAIDLDGNLYVSDRDNSRVQVFKPVVAP